MHDVSIDSCNNLTIPRESVLKVWRVGNIIMMIWCCALFAPTLFQMTGYDPIAIAKILPTQLLILQSSK